MKIRYAKKTEKEIAKKYWQENFKDSQEQINFYFENIFNYKNFLVLEQNKKVVSSLHENPYIFNFNGTEIESKYIVGVATDIREQRKGYMNTLIKEMLKISRKEFYPFVFLTPINPDIYRRYGFEYFSKMEKFNFNIENLKDLDITKDSKFIEISLENKDKYIEDLIEIYNKNMEKYFCFLKRDKYYFNKLLLECLSDGMKIFLLHKNSGPVAYIIYSKYDAKIEIRESFSVDYKTYKDIFGFLYAYRDYYKNIELCTAENSNLEYLFKNQLDIKKTEFPFMMLRILNPLEVLKYTNINLENLKIYVEDNTLEENTGIYSYRNKNWKFAKKIDNYSFKIDIGDLSSLLTGFFSFDEMLSMKKINLKINDKNSLNKLKEIFKKRQSYLYEFQ